MTADSAIERFSYRDARGPIADSETASRDSAVMRFQSRAATACGGASQEPPTQTTLARVFLPQQLQRDAEALQLLMDEGLVGREHSRTLKPDSR